MLSAGQPTQEDVFRSISENVRESDTNPRTVPLFLLAGAAVFLILVVTSLKRKRKATPRPLNHPGKLSKELARRVPIRPGELRQLRLLAEASRQGQPRAGEPPDAGPFEDDPGGGAAREGTERGDRGESQAVENPWVYVLCPSLMVEAMRSKPPKIDKQVMGGLARKMGLLKR